MAAAKKKKGTAAKAARVFGGSRYSLAGTYTTKRDADKKAKKLRETGFNARVVQRTNTRGKKVRDVYKRRR